jgi:ABC-type amino acid transport substrate-binding protein
VITAERERRVDFSAPYFDSGLRIMVGSEEGSVLQGTLATLLSPAMLGLAAIGAGLVLLLAHALWLVERRHNAAFQRGYLRGIAEGIWGTWLIFATGEHGDRDTPRVIKRLSVGAMWLMGVLFIAQLTAMVTSGLTVQQLRSGIEGPGDLPGKVIATAPGSIAADWLTGRGLPFVALTDTETAYTMLISGEIQAIVYDASQLEYFLATRGPNQASLVGPVFRQQRYGIAVAPGSPLRERVNAALLAMQEDGTAEEITARWFGARR